ncbi:GTP 3',8-cyclase MoaA [candidate division KSB1 bacterium]
MQFIDKHGRKITSLRVSVTDRCNFRCSYCMPQSKFEWIPHEDILCYEEFLRIIGMFSEIGLYKIKVTGGEPLMRKGLPGFIGELRKIDGITDISLTTNGFFLDKYAAELYEAGLGRITVSLDTLREERFNKIVANGHFKKIYENILKLKETPFKNSKLNVVAIRGFNDDEVSDFIRFSQETGFSVRFIEFMPLDGDKNWSEDRVVSASEILSKIRSEFDFEQVAGFGVDSPASRYKLTDGSAEFGLIPTVSSPFCENCGRVRLTSTGHLRTCLFSDKETDLRSLLRGGSSDDDLREAIKNALFNKEIGHLIDNPAFTPPNRPMNEIGG